MSFKTRVSLAEEGAFLKPSGDEGGGAKTSCGFGVNSDSHSISVQHEEIIHTAEVFVSQSIHYIEKIKGLLIEW